MQAGPLLCVAAALPSVGSQRKCMQAQSSSYANAIPYNGGGGGGGLGWGGMLMTHPHHDAMMEFG